MVTNRGSDRYDDVEPVTGAWEEPDPKTLTHADLKNGTWWNPAVPSVHNLLAAAKKGEPAPSPEAVEEPTIAEPKPPKPEHVIPGVTLEKDRPKAEQRALWAARKRRQRERNRLQGR